MKRQSTKNSKDIKVELKLSCQRQNQAQNLRVLQKLYWTPKDTDRSFKIPESVQCGDYEQIGCKFSYVLCSCYHTNNMQDVLKHALFQKR